MRQTEGNSDLSDLKSPIWARAVVFGVAYIALAGIGRAFSIRPGAFVPFWLPSGLFVATLLMHERKHWQVFILAGLLANTGFDLLNGQAPHISLLFFTGNMLEAVTGVWLVQRFVAERPIFRSAREVLGVCGFAMIGVALGASIGAGVVSFILHGGPFWETWLLWWSGDMVGIFMVTPLILSWRERFCWPWQMKWSRQRRDEIIYFVVLCLVTFAIFFDPWHHDLALKYIAIPVVAFGAIMFGLRVTTLASLVVSLIAAWNCVYGFSLISRSGLLPQHQALTLQLFLAVLAFCGLIISGLIGERIKVELALKHSKDMMERTENMVRLASFEWDVDSNIVKWSPEMFRIFGRDPVLGIPNLEGKVELYTPQSTQTLFDAVQKAVSDGTPYELELMTVQPNGEQRPCFVKGFPEQDASGRVVRVVGLVQDITDRKQAEAQLRKMTDRFSLASQAGGVGVWDWDVVSNHLIWDDQMYRLYGIEASRFSGAYEAWRAGLHPDDSVRGDVEIQMALLGEKNFNTEFRVVWPDGSVHFIRALGLVQRDTSGKPLRMIGTNWDITEIKQAGEALRESEERWKFAIEGAGDGLWDWNLQTGVAYFSPRYKEMLGYTDAEIGTTSDEWSKRIHPDDAPVVFAALQPYMDGMPGHATVEFRMLCKDGSWLWIQGRGMVVGRDPAGKPIRIIGVNTDITEQKETKDALLAQTTALTAVIDNNPMSIQILDKVGRTTKTNPAFLKLFGATPPPDYSIFSDPTLASQGLSSLFDRIQAGEVIYFPEVPYNVHNIFPEFPDTPVWVRTLGFPIISNGGQPERFVLMHEDVTQRRHEEQVKADLQAQLQQSQKLESLGTLAGGVAHDMNNVLGAILGLASAHIDTLPYGSPLHQALDTICKATERGGKTVKSLLSFARQSQVENSRLDMNEILKEEVTLLERTTLAKVRLEVDFDADLRPIRGDASAMTHAFMNLCVNAVDAMPENGTLTLHTRNVDNDWIEVVVEDNGTGMSKDVLEKAMEPFYTTKETGKGTGLGLSMVFSTVKAHGGQISIESEQGKGTRVMMRFPAIEADTTVLAATTADNATALLPLSNLKVLLIDDDELIQSSTLAVLEVMGHTAVTTAQSGEEALTMLEAGLDPDLVILDMNMPGLGGAGTLPRLRLLRPEVPVLLATGRVDQTVLALASAHPGVILLPKPYGMKELQKHIESSGMG